MSRWSRRIRGAIFLLRPANAVMMAVGVVLGAWLAGGRAAFENGSGLWIAALSAALLGSAANAMNDVLDMEADRTNRPERPIPSGRITPAGAMLIAAVAGGAALVLAWSLSTMHGLLATLATVLLLAYNIHFKRVAVAGNAMVSAVVGLSILFGVGSSPWSEAVWIAVAFAVLITWAREIVKDIEDEPGDRRAGYKTLPIIAGTATALRTTGAFLAVVLVGGPVPYVSFSFGGTYLLGMILTESVIAGCLIRLSTEHFDPASVSRTLKWAMILGMASLAAFDWQNVLG